MALRRVPLLWSAAVRVAALLPSLAPIWVLLASVPLVLLSPIPLLLLLSTIALLLLPSIPLLAPISLPLPRPLPLRVARLALRVAVVPPSSLVLPAKPLPLPLEIGDHSADEPLPSAARATVRTTSSNSAAAEEATALLLRRLVAVGVLLLLGVGGLSSGAGDEVLEWGRGLAPACDSGLGEKETNADDGHCCDSKLGGGLNVVWSEEKE